MPVLNTEYFHQHAAMCRSLAGSIDGIMEPNMRRALLAMADQYEVTAAELEAIERKSMFR